MPKPEKKNDGGPVGCYNQKKEKRSEKPHLSEHSDRYHSRNRQKERRYGKVQMQRVWVYL